MLLNFGSSSLPSSEKKTVLIFFKSFIDCNRPGFVVYQNNFKFMMKKILNSKNNVLAIG